MTDLPPWDNDNYFTADDVERAIEAMTTVCWDLLRLVRAEGGEVHYEDAPRGRYTIDGATAFKAVSGRTVKRCYRATYLNWDDVEGDLFLTAEGEAALLARFPNLDHQRS